MRWTCFCGKQMSNTLSPCPNGYEVYSEAEMDQIWTLPEGVDAFDYRDFPNSKINAYVCPDCGRIIVFKVDKDGKYEDRFYSYAPEPKSPLEKLFSEASWRKYIEMWEEEETETGSLSETVITQIRNGAEGEVVDTFHDEDVRLIHIGNYSFSYIHNSNSGGILLIDRVRTKNLGAHNRIKNAVNALGGQDELDKLPEYFRERLIANDDLDAKARILEAIVEIKEWV